MARVYNILASDTDPNIQPGMVMVNSLNVAPSTVVATPTTGTTFNIALLSNYDFFNVAQTGNANDFISLPAAIPIGTVLHFYAISACKVEAVSSTINGISSATDITMPAGSVSILRKLTATAWVLSQISSAGVMSGPTS